MKSRSHNHSETTFSTFASPVAPNALSVPGQPLVSNRISAQPDAESLASAPQLELGFASSRSGLSQEPRLSASDRRRRLGRAQWWFQRMRQIVDRACDWQPAPPPRPEQIWFSATHPSSS